MSDFNLTVYKYFEMIYYFYKSSYFLFKNINIYFNRFKYLFILKGSRVSFYPFNTKNIVFRSTLKKVYFLRRLQIGVVRYALMCIYMPNHFFTGPAHIFLLGRFFLFFFFFFLWCFFFFFFFFFLKKNKNLLFYFYIIDVSCVLLGISTHFCHFLLLDSSISN